MPNNNNYEGNNQGSIDIAKCIIIFQAFLAQVFVHQKCRALNPSDMSRGRSRSRKYFFRAVLLAIFLIPTYLRTTWKSSSKKLSVLTFETQGGFTNQVLDIAYVTTLVAVTKPSFLVVPGLWSDGTQAGGINLKESPRVPFEELFDLETFRLFLAQQGVELRKENHKRISSPVRCEVICQSQHLIQDCIRLITAKPSQKCEVSHVHVEAPFLHNIWSSAFLRQHEKLFGRVLENLRPSAVIAAEVENTHSELLIQSPGQKLCFVHARIEKDWHRHCLQWHPYKSDYRYDCYVGLAEIFERIIELRIKNCVFHITFDANQVPASTSQVVKFLAEQAGIVVFQSKRRVHEKKSREVNAAIQYFLALRADNFVGNSVSTLSALVMLLRQKRNLWCAQYNRGPIPLATFVPGYRLPWVFTVRGSDEAYDEMMKLAVLSALRRTTLIPHAIVHLTESKFPRVSWLRKHGVTVIPHSTSWDDIVMAALRGSSEDEKSTSHLLLDVEATLATYFRLDIGAIPELVHHQHILYTDTDVFFRKDVNYFSQATLPDTIQMGYEIDSKFPLNAGVYLASVEFLRETHSTLIDYVLSSQSVNQVGYGPGDQGILNKVYENELKANGALDDIFNSKPYKKFNKQAAIIHFHGPKIHDYVKFIREKKCRFGNLCKKGLEHGFCEYFRDMKDIVDTQDSTHMPAEADMVVLRRQCKGSGVRDFRIRGS